MKVKDAMTPHCERLKASDSIGKAAQIMRDKDIGMVMIEDERGELSGIVTDRDITCRGIASGASADAQLGDCMSKDLISCHADDNLQEALELMEREQVRRLLVLDQQEQPAGILAQADIARALGRSPMIGELLGKISQPTGKHTQH